MRRIIIKKLKLRPIESQRQIYWASEQRYIRHNISVTCQKFFGYFTEDTSSQHTDYRGIYIFLVKRVLKAWEAYYFKKTKWEVKRFLSDFFLFLNLLISFQTSICDNVKANSSVILEDLVLTYFWSTGW